MTIFIGKDVYKMLTVIRTASLTPAQSGDAAALTELVMRHNGLKCRPELSNELNLDKSLPCFFLAYDGDTLVSLVYAFIPGSDEAELYALTHPDYLRRGYFSKLLYELKAEYRTAGIPSLLYTVEDASECGQAAVLAHSALIYERAEYRMEYTGKPDAYGGALTFRTLTEASRGEYRELIIAAFGDREEPDVFIDAELKNPGRTGYMAYSHGVPAGVFSIGVEDGASYIYGVAVKKELRGGGIGSDMMRYALGETMIRHDRAILDVDKDNANALHIYKKLGFTVSFRMDYYRENL